MAQAAAASDTQPSNKSSLFQRVGLQMKRAGMFIVIYLFVVKIGNSDSHHFHINQKKFYGRITKKSDGRIKKKFNRRIARRNGLLLRMMRISYPPERRREHRLRKLKKENKSLLRST